MARMPNAPLHYVLMVARFPKILSMANHVPAFQEAIRQEYPNFDAHMDQGFNVALAPDGALRMEWTNEPVWQFADATRGHAIILGTELLVLHAGSAYTTHVEFIDRFARAASALQAIQTLALQQVHGLGYRYVNLVVPRTDKGEALSGYIQSWALPSDAPDLSTLGLTLNESAHVTTFATMQGTARLQTLRRPPGALPPDLASPLVVKNGWVPTRPEVDFAILDIDHSMPLNITQALNPEALKATFVSLRDVAHTIFTQATTEYATMVWEGKA